MSAEAWNLETKLAMEGPQAEAAIQDRKALEELIAYRRIDKVSQEGKIGECVELRPKFTAKYITVRNKNGDLTAVRSSPAEAESDVSDVFELIAEFQRRINLLCIQSAAKSLQQLPV